MLRIHRRSVSSIELIKIGVEAAKSAHPVDITIFPVKVALAVEGVHPAVGDFVDGAWETIDGEAYATALVGSGGIVLTLTDETYIPWVRVAAGATIVEARCFEDVIEVY